jgi:hypothetical protein
VVTDNYLFYNAMLQGYTGKISAEMCKFIMKEVRRTHKARQLPWNFHFLPNAVYKVND